VETFRNKLRGLAILKKNSTHCGEEGHFIERQFGIQPNSNNEPDILGYEIMSYEIMFLVIKYYKDMCLFILIFHFLKN